ncbi:hypothetical protein Syun_023073 [Stephania yunnanensis]|uniref:Uncharacterized protein n=1 Tax=Stephania yunnanensis TaxID=152371 RepID=A0AAP0FB35_9MAGN
MRPNFVTSETWTRFQEYRARTDYKVRSQKASENRKSKKDSPGTCISKHNGGSKSFRTHAEILALDKEDLTPNDVFLHVHTKDHDGETFIDGRLARLHVCV